MSPIFRPFFFNSQTPATTSAPVKTTSKTQRKTSAPLKLNQELGKLLTTKVALGSLGLCAAALTAYCGYKCLNSFTVLPPVNTTPPTQPPANPVPVADASMPQTTTPVNVKLRVEVASVIEELKVVEDINAKESLGFTSDVVKNLSDDHNLHLAQELISPKVEVFPAIESNEYTQAFSKILNKHVEKSGECIPSTSISQLYINPNPVSRFSAPIKSKPSTNIPPKQRTEEIIKDPRSNDSFEAIVQPDLFKDFTKATAQEEAVQTEKAPVQEEVVQIEKAPVQEEAVQTEKAPVQEEVVQIESLVREEQVNYVLPQTPFASEQAENEPASYVSTGIKAALATAIIFGLNLARNALKDKQERAEIIEHYTAPTLYLTAPDRVLMITNGEQQGMVEEDNLDDVFNPNDPLIPHGANSVIHSPEQNQAEVLPSGLEDKRDDLVGSSEEEAGLEQGNPSLNNGPRISPENSPENSPRKELTDDESVEESVIPTSPEIRKTRKNVFSELQSRLKQADDEKSLNVDSSSLYNMISSSDNKEEDVQSLAEELNEENLNLNLNASPRTSPKNSPHSSPKKIPRGSPLREATNTQTNNISGIEIQVVPSSPTNYKATEKTSTPPLSPMSQFAKSIQAKKNSDPSSSIELEPINGVTQIKKNNHIDGVRAKVKKNTLPPSPEKYKLPFGVTATTKNRKVSRRPKVIKDSLQLSKEANLDKVAKKSPQKSQKKLKPVIEFSSPLSQQAASRTIVRDNSPPPSPTKFPSPFSSNAVNTRQFHTKDLTPRRIDYTKEHDVEVLNNNNTNNNQITLS